MLISFFSLLLLPSLFPFPHLPFPSPFPLFPFFHLFLFLGIRVSLPKLPGSHCVPKPGVTLMTILVIWLPQDCSNVPSCLALLLHSSIIHSLNIYIQCIYIYTYIYFFCFVCEGGHIYPLILFWASLSSEEYNIILKHEF